jgi:hypothetical protein
MNPVMKKHILLSSTLFLLVGMTSKAQENTNAQATANGTPTHLKTANPEYKETPANGTPTWERIKNPNYQENTVQPGKKEEAPSAERKKNPEQE